MSYFPTTAQHLTPGTEVVVAYPGHYTPQAAYSSAYMWLSYTIFDNPMSNYIPASFVSKRVAATVVTVTAGAHPISKAQGHTIVVDLDGEEYEFFIHPGHKINADM